MVGAGAEMRRPLTRRNNYGVFHGFRHRRYARLVIASIPDGKNLRAAAFPKIGNQQDRIDYHVCTGQIN